MHADLPGVKKDDLHVELHDDIVTVSGKRESKKTEKNDKYHYIERCASCAAQRSAACGRTHARDTTD